jgi:hypothetical protein
MKRTRALRIAAALGMATGVVFVSVGFLRPAIEIRTTQAVSRSPHVAFSVLTDGDRLGEWMAGFVSFERILDRDAPVGNQSVLTMLSGSDTLQLRQEVTAFAEGREMKVAFETDGMAGYTEMELTPVSAGTEIMTTTRIEGTAWWMRSLLPFLEPGLRRTQAEDYARAAALIEAVEAPLVGWWAGIDQWGNEQLFQFSSDGEVRWEAAAGEERFALDGIAWHLDRDSRPLRLDLTRFGDGPLQGMGLYGIIEFLSDDSLRVDLESGPEGQTGVRPEDFTESSVVIRRIR